MVFYISKHDFQTKVWTPPPCWSLIIPNFQLMQPKEIKKMIEAGLPGAQAKVYSNDNTHFEAVVIYAGFADKMIVKQHQMVYATLGNHIQSNDIHALSLKTYTPQEWEKIQTQA